MIKKITLSQQERGFSGYLVLQQEIKFSGLLEESVRKSREWVHGHKRSVAVRLL